MFNCVYKENKLKKLQQAILKTRKYFQKRFSSLHLQKIHTPPRPWSRRKREKKRMGEFMRLCQVQADKNMQNWVEHRLKMARMAWG